MFGSQSPSSSRDSRDDVSDMSFDETPEINLGNLTMVNAWKFWFICIYFSGDRPLEELTLVELQVELEKTRETASLQLREHAEEIETVCRTEHCSFNY